MAIIKLFKPACGTKILRIRTDNQNAPSFFSHDIPFNGIAVSLPATTCQPNTPHGGNESKPSFQPNLLLLCYISRIYEKIVSLFYEKLQFVKSIMGTKKT